MRAVIVREDDDGVRLLAKDFSALDQAKVLVNLKVGKFAVLETASNITIGRADGDTDHRQTAGSDRRREGVGEHISTRPERPSSGGRR